MSSGITRELSLCAVDSDSASYRSLLTELEGQLAGAVIGSGREALRLAAVQSPQLWLINVKLPDMAGVDLLAMLRQIAARGTYCLVGDEYRAEEELAAHRLGGHAYLCKPLAASWILRLACSPGQQASRASPQGLSQTSLAAPFEAAGHQQSKPQRVRLD